MEERMGNLHRPEQQSRLETADLWPNRFVVRRSQPLSGSFRRGTAPSSRVGFPSPPRVSFPTGDERFAFCGAVGPNLWPRHLRSFMRWLLEGLAAKERMELIERNGLTGLGSSRRNHAFNVDALFRALDVQNDPSYG
jgi:hypothetical protein